MKRLTKRYASHIAVVCDNCKEKGSYCDTSVCRDVMRNRLAEYEDTGLEPKDIQEAVDLFKDWRNADIPKELKSWVERCTWHVRKCEELRRELDEYKKAESEGRLVVLPCKVGDTVWFNTYKGSECIGIKPHKVEKINVLAQLERGYAEPCTEVPDWAFGKTVFLTREEAEKALEGNNG